MVDKEQTDIILTNKGKQTDQNYSTLRHHQKMCGERAEVIDIKLTIRSRRSVYYGLHRGLSERFFVPSTRYDAYTIEYDHIEECFAVQFDRFYPNDHNIIINKT